MGFIQEVFMKIFMLFVPLLAHYGQPYLFKILLSPQFFPTPNQLAELLQLHPGATILNLETDMNLKNAAGEIAKLSGGLVKYPATIDGFPMPLGGTSAINSELTEAASALPGVVGGLPKMTNPISGIPSGLSGIGNWVPATVSGQKELKELEKPSLAGLLEAGRGGLGAVTQTPAATIRAPATSSNPSILSGGPPAASDMATNPTTSAIPDLVKVAPETADSLTGARISENLASKLKNVMGGSSTKPISSVTGFSSADPGLEEFIGKGALTTSGNMNATEAAPLNKSGPLAEDPTTSRTVGAVNTPRAGLVDPLGKTVPAVAKNVSLVGGGGLPWTLIGKKA